MRVCRFNTYLMVVFLSVWSPGVAQERPPSDSAIMAADSCFATGDVGCDPGGIADIADLAYLFSLLDPQVVSLPCAWQLDVNGDCIVDTSDVWAIINCIFTTPLLCNWNTPTCCNPEVRLPPPCCVGITGNVDGDVNDISDIADLTFLIDHLFINFPSLPCAEEANVDGSPDGVVDIADLTRMIGNGFICFAGCPLAPCGGF